MTTNTESTSGLICVMGEKNFQAARRIGSRLKPPVSLTEVERTQEIPGFILITALIEGPSQEFWKRLRKKEAKLPLPQLPPIPPIESQEPIDDYSELKST